MSITLAGQQSEMPCARHMVPVIEAATSWIFHFSMILRDAVAVCGRRVGGSRQASFPVWPPHLRLSKRHNHHVVQNRQPFRLAIIGSGPAGFYGAYRVMSRIENAVVDMFEKLPVPYGLVRFGVAPDHPEVKVRGPLAFQEG